MRNPLRRLRALLLLVLLSVLVLLAVGLCLLLDSLFPCRLPSLLGMLSCPLLAAGLLLIASAEWQLLRQGGATGAPGDRTRRLVTGGIYARMRNPVYLGGAAVLLGLSFRFSSPALLVLAAVFVTAVHLIVIRFEEPRAQQRFGEEYRQYLREVPRWIPTLRKKKDAG